MIPLFKRLFSGCVVGGLSYTLFYTLWNLKLRSKILGVIRYCEARRNLTRTFIVGFHLVFWAPCSVKMIDSDDSGLLPAGWANMEQARCIGRRCGSEEIWRDLVFTLDLVFTCIYIDLILNSEWFQLERVVPIEMQLLTAKQWILLWEVRKTKRQRLEEMMEWDEANKGGDVPDHHQDLGWGMWEEGKGHSPEPICRV